MHGGKEVGRSSFSEGIAGIVSRIRTGKDNLRRYPVRAPAEAMGLTQSSGSVETGTYGFALFNVISIPGKSPPSDLEVSLISSPLSLMVPS